MEADYEKLKNLLQSRGHKATKARMAVLSTFSPGCEPMSARDVHAKIRKTKVDYATVYRILSAFLKSGILKVADLRKDSVYFELGSGHHHHMVCTDCGLVEDFDNCRIEKLGDSIIKSSSNFKKINDHSFELFGLCRSCS